MRKILSTIVALIAAIAILTIMPLALNFTNTIKTLPVVNSSFPEKFSNHSLIISHLEPLSSVRTGNIIIINDNTLGEVTNISSDEENSGTYTVTVNPNSYDIQPVTYKLDNSIYVVTESIPLIGLFATTLSNPTGFTLVFGALIVILIVLYTKYYDPRPVKKKIEIVEKVDYINILGNIFDAVPAPEPKKKWWSKRAKPVPPVWENTPQAEKYGTLVTPLKNDLDDEEKILITDTKTGSIIIDEGSSETAPVEVINDLSEPSGAGSDSLNTEERPTEHIEEQSPLESLTETQDDEPTETNNQPTFDSIIAPSNEEEGNK